MDIEKVKKLGLSVSGFERYLLCIGYTKIQIAADPGIVARLLNDPDMTLAYEKWEERKADEKDAGRMAVAS